MKTLFIDDNTEWIGSMKKIFSDKDSVVFAECHNVEEALHVVEVYQPEVIFLDHQLTEGGNEGFEIINKISEIKIYSTTANREIAQEYQKRGIEVVKKNDLQRFTQILSQ